MILEKINSSQSFGTNSKRMAGEMAVETLED